MAITSTAPVSPQSDTTALPIPSLSAESPLGSEALNSFFGDPAPRAEISARIAAWDPEEGAGLIAVRYVYPEGYHQIDDDEFFTLKPTPAEGIIFGGTLKGEPIIKDGLLEYFDETTLVMEFRASPDIAPRELEINALFQICDEEGICLFPDSELQRIPFNPGSPPLEPDEVVKAVLTWSASLSDGESLQIVATDPPRTPIRGGSLLLFLLAAFLGGILLNVMPCVLPLLSVKALNLVKQAGQDSSVIWKHSWLYVVGIIVSFWTLAAIIIGLQTSGLLLGWGFQFQSPGFVLILTAAIWVFALSMFDVFVFEAPQKGMEAATAAGSRGGYFGSFLTGIFAVLVATPCTAPLLGPALGFAFSQPPGLILVIFTVTGLGFGLPFLLLGRWPKVIEKLPKPGPWTSTFKEIMGFLMLGTAVYLFTTFAKLRPNAVIGSLWWIFTLGFASWLLGRARRPSSRRGFRIAGQVAALALALGSGLWLVDLDPPDRTPIERPRSTSLENSNVIFFEESDILARIEGEEPIFLEFTAAWCTTCKINQRVLNNRRVREMMNEKGVVHIIGDLTAYDATLARWLADFGRAGVPLYVLYRPGEDPYLFRTIISVNGIIRELRKIDS